MIERAPMNLQPVSPIKTRDGLDAHLLARLRQVSFPTLGHFLETGFLDPDIRSLLEGVRMVGRAVTARIADADARAVNRALDELRAGDVLVLDMCGDRQHAPIGAVTSCAAQQVGAAGIVIDGVATDVVELRNAGLPVFARGTSLLTTKPLPASTSQINVPIVVGGVPVSPGDIVLADGNGVLILPQEAVGEVIDRALASDAAEPNVLARLRAGEPLADVLDLG
jgi:4-hydroxy-4-methyl-2-oxoglutarate aldolase